MRLGEVLWKKLRLPLGFKGPKGHIFRGKYRLVKKVTPEAVKDYMETVKLEEQNLFYLRHPYLTLTQASGYAKELDKNHKWHLNNLRVREDAFINKRKISIIEELERLKISEDWDKIPS